MLSMLQYVVQLAFMHSQPRLSQRDQKVMSDFPSDIRSATAQFLLEGKHTIYAVCPNPKCHHTHKPVFDGDSPIPNYPMYCTYVKYGKRCKERLLRPRVYGSNVQAPIKPFVYFDFKDWVAGLISRPGFEDQMDAAWDATVVDNETMSNIFDEVGLKTFNGPDGKHFREGGSEGHYVFSLCVDFFNPRGNKQAGKSISCGLISLVCLNLPPDIRYKPENMFLAGIIPGPCEPPLTTLNHYLTPLVDDLLEFWQGVWFSRTCKFPHGRICHCALVVIVCDLPGAKKVAGFAAHSHNHFCSICHCTRSEHGYGNTDHSSWKRRTNDECRFHADQYKNAGNEKEKQSIFDESGLRWSELLHLPYFDPTQFVVINAMHNLFLGLIKEHFINILGIQVEKEVVNDNPVVVVISLSDHWKSFTENEQKSVKKVKKWLEGPMNDEMKSNSASWVKRLMRIHVRVLMFVCTELQCPRLPVTNPYKNKTTKMDWVNMICDWVSSC